MEQLGSNLEKAKTPTVNALRWLKVEQMELRLKIEKLTEFMWTGPFFALSNLERSDLEMQLKAMTLYQEILDRRIRRAGG